MKLITLKCACGCGITFERSQNAIKKKRQWGQQNFYYNLEHANAGNRNKCKIDLTSKSLYRKNSY